MKKIMGIVLISAVLFTAAACGSSGELETGEDEPALYEMESEEGKAPETESEAVQESEMPAEIQPAESIQKDVRQEEAGMKMKVQIGDYTFTATLVENSSVDALKELFADGSLTLNMSDYANMEKGADLGVTLPQNNTQMNTQAGDIILYQGRTFVIYYDTNSWSLTPIGKIDDVDAEELREALGTGDVTVVLSLEDEK